VLQELADLPFGPAGFRGDEVKDPIGEASMFKDGLEVPPFSFDVVPPEEIVLEGIQCDEEGATEGLAEAESASPSGDVLVLGPAASF